MNRIHRTLILAVISCLLVSVVAILALWETPASQATQEFIPLVQQEFADGVSYNVTYDSTQQRVYATKSFDYISKDGIQAYIDFNRTQSQAIAHRSSTSVPIYVIFNHPLALETFSKFVENYKLHVRGYTMRAVEANGTRVTIYGTPENGALVPQQTLTSVLKELTQRNGTTFNGWIEVEGSTTPAMAGAIQDDPNVFGIEAIYTFVYDALTPAALQKVGIDPSQATQLQANDQRDVQITGPSLYWVLEDQGAVGP